MSRNLRHILYFVLISYSLAWAVALPLWLGNGLFDENFRLLAAIMMFTPGLAALIMVLAIERGPQKFTRLGLWPLKPAKRFILFMVLGLLIPVALIMQALLVGTMLGLYPGDFTEFSGYKFALEYQLALAGETELPYPIGVLVALQFVNVLIGALINLIPALGEELGWRGWLLPKLMAYGPLPAILISGVLWGLWHAPLILLGYNYPLAPGWLGMIMMTGMCISVGAIFGWLRLRSDSVWPAALAHATFNAAAGLMLVFLMRGKNIDTINATILGWSGWILPLIFVVVIVVSKKFRAQQLSTSPTQHPTS
ncbi:CPBP family intramembrane metalloprotease domain-containing protein [Arthrobacter sp. MYb227]|uniref:CPBP family intramembrane glutamic endopeptidase n=1 Tax=Arthrobacter sp. MYb227 TaxID=1848601 RepID=UPI000CFAC354|nr:type II CAAX endopeptidase family protein [Arthrobacter sp. MYb227]PQZ93571.1 CPBP family intramembrane metalloprotease domain-containing protein [Arthrobacter sp. MYb227]